MNIDWQTIASLPIVAVAAAYVFKHAWLTFRQPEATRCGGCAASKTCSAKNLNLVQLGAPRQKSEGG